jgi:hypothetical protein
MPTIVGSVGQPESRADGKTNVTVDDVAATLSYQQAGSRADGKTTVAITGGGTATVYLGQAGSRVDGLLSTTAMSGGGGGESSTAISAPVAYSLYGDTLEVFGFGRLTEYFAEATVRLKKVSGGEERDFTPLSDNRFDWATFNAWAGSDDTNVVRFYGQHGSGLTAEAQGTVAFTRSGVATRCGAVYNAATGLSTRSTTQGAAAANLAGSGCFVITGVGGNVGADGLRAYVLCSFNRSKVASGIDNFSGGNHDQESIIDYGTQYTNNVRVIWDDVSVSAFYPVMRTQINAGTSVSDNSPDLTLWLANTQRLFELTISGTNTRLREFYDTPQDITMGGTAQTAVAAGSIDDGTLIVGGRFATASGGEGAINTIHTGEYGDFALGAIVITKNTLTADETFILQNRLNNYAQEHLDVPYETFLDLFDEVMDGRKINATTGLLVGDKGKTSFQYTVAPVTEGTPTWDLDYIDPTTGLRCAYSPSADNMANGWTATNEYMAQKRTGTFICMWKLEDNGVGSTLTYPLGIRNAGEQHLQNRQNSSVMFGPDHKVIALRTKIANDVDPTFIYGQGGTRRVYHVSQAALPAEDRDYIAFGDALNTQGHVKYRDCTDNKGAFDAYGETLTVTFPSPIGEQSQVVTEASLRNEEVGQNIFFDAPVNRMVPTGMDFPYRFDVPILQIATIEEPDGWVAGGFEANIERLQNARVQVFGAVVGTPIGHVVSDYAQNDYAFVPLAASGSRMMSVPWFADQWAGCLYYYAFIPDVALTYEQAQQLSVNFYKLLDDTVNAPLEAPSFTEQPSIVGSALEAGIIRCLHGNAGGVPLARYTYQWFVYGSEPADPSIGGTSISGATAVSYTNPTDIPALGANKWRACRVTATNSEGSDVAWTDAVEIIQLVAPVRTVDPTLGGFVNEGQSVTITTGTYTGTSPITLLRRHYLDNVIDATGLTFTFSGDTGKSYKWDEVASNPKGSTTVTSTPVTVGAVLPYNLISTINSNELRVNFDLRANETASYSGSGTRLANLETAPYDGAAQAAYDFIMQNYSLVGTAGQNGSYLEAAANGAMVIDAANVAAMPAWARQLHHDSTQTGTLTNGWFAFFGRFINATSGDQYLFGTRKTGTNTIGCNAHYNASELMRVQQANGTTSTQSTPASPAIVTGSDSYIVVSRNGTSNNLKIWYGSATAGLDTTASYVTASADPDNLLTLCAGSVLSGTARLPLQTGARIDAISGGKQHLTNAMVSSLVTHMNTELGKSYSL